MPNQAIAPVIPNIGNQEAAMAGSSAIIFTATDRQIIQERAGEINRSRSFIDILKNNPLTPEVENEETAVKSQPDIKELEGRYREHQRILKHSALYAPREKVEITNELPDTYEEKGQIVDKRKAGITKEDKMMIEETVAMAKELKLNPIELFDKFALEQKELFGLISRVKELHLKRLLSEKQNEFKSLTEEIKIATYASAKPEAKDWLKAQLDKLTYAAAEYKLSLLISLQSMDFDEQRKQTMRWLERILASLG